MAEAQLRGIIADALAGQSEEAEGTADADVLAEASPDSEDETPEAVVETEDVAGESESTDPAVDEATDEPPTTYFAEDLSAFDADQRREVIGLLEKREDFIGKLLREKASGESAEADVPEPEPVAELTDEAILQAFGLDPEQNPFDENTAKVVVPLFREIQSLRTEVGQLTEDSQLTAIANEWNTTLDALSKEFGELPVDNIAVMEYAGANGVASPQDAYWRIAGPARRQVGDAMKAVEARLAKESAKKKATSTRPSSTSADSEPGLDEKDTKSATLTAARAAMAKLGISFSDD